MRKGFYLILFLLIFPGYGYADAGDEKKDENAGQYISSTPKKPIELIAAVTAVKMRQGESFKLFDGIAGGVKYSPYYDSSDWLQGLHCSGLFMISSSTETNTSDPKDKKQVQVFSGGLVIGYYWLEFGVGRDFLSSESPDTFNAKEKTFFMVNLGGTFK